MPPSAELIQKVELTGSIAAAMKPHGALTMITAMLNS